MIQYIQKIKRKKTKTKNILMSSIVLFISLLFLQQTSIHAQIKKNTKIDKVKRNTYNFQTIRKYKRKQKKDKNLYSVYSDRSNNNTYLDSYAQKSGDKQDFLSPYYVIDQENDFLQIVSLDPTLIGKPKGLFSFLSSGKYTFSDVKKVDYKGWIHKNNVLHYNHPKLSEYNYKPMRYVVGIHDLNTLYSIENHVNKDSVYLYKDPMFKDKSDKKLMLDQLVYLYKYNAKKSAALVSNLGHMKPEDSVSRTMGWIPEFLIKEVGQQQIYTVDKVDSIAFFEKENKLCEYVNKKEIGSNIIFNLSKNKKRLFRSKDSIQVAVPLQVWNHQDNKLINIDGEDVFIRKLKTIKEENKVINFHYIFDCSKQLKKKQLLFMSSLQSLWVMITTDKKYSDYEFNFSASSYGCGKFYSFPKNKSFSQWIDYLQNVFTEDKSIATNGKNTEGIEQCFNYAISDIPKQSFTNNIIIVSGEERFFSLPHITTIATKLGQTSSRLIFYQLENKSDDNHQDFILQSKDILSKVSKHHANFIRAFVVDNNMLKNDNTYVSIPSSDNIYVYDAPDNSTYQGGIVFPKINKRLSPISFDKALDSVLTKTIKFNNKFTNSLDYHINKLGFLRSKSGEKITELIQKDTVYSDKVGMIPRNFMQEKFYENKNYTSQDNPETLEGCLLSKEELEIIVDSYKSLVPLFSNDVSRKQRRQLYKMYKKNYKSINKKLYRKILKRRNYVADLVFFKTGLPVQNEYFHKTKIKHIKSKRKASHTEFTTIIKNLRKKIDELEKVLSNKNSIVYLDGSQKKYYFISSNYIL